MSVRRRRIVRAQPTEQAQPTEPEPELTEQDEARASKRPRPMSRAVPPKDEVPVDEVPGRSYEESDSEYMTYEEYRTRKALHGNQGLGG